MEPGLARAAWWRSALVWTAAGSLAALLGVVITLVAWWFPQSQRDAGIGTGQTAGTTAPLPTRASPSTGASATSEPSGPTGPSTGPGGPPVWARGAGVLFITGTPHLYTRPGAADLEPQLWDLDVNDGISDFPPLLSSEQRRVDLIIEHTALGGENGTAFAA